MAQGGGRSRRGGSQKGQGRAPQASSSSASTAPETVTSDLLLDQPMDITAPRPGPPPEGTATLAKRPGFGTVGDRTLIKANHFLVKLSDCDLHHYDVSITPKASLAANKEIMRALLWSEGKTNFSGHQPAYDGRNALYTAGPLPFDSNNFVVKIARDEAGFRRRPLEYKVSINLASRVDLDSLQEFLGGGVADAPHEIIQALDVVLRETPSKNFEVVIGRSFFTSGMGQPVDIGNGVECLKGFYQSLRPTQMGMSLNINVVATSFYASIHVDEFVKDFLNLRHKSIPSSPLSESEWKKLNEVLKGVKVKTAHGAPRCYRITQLSRQPIYQLNFHKKDGSEKSVVGYFEERYGIKLTYNSWPALQSGSDAKPIYLPMEICRIVRGQRYVKKLHSHQVTHLLREACEPPSYREKKIERIARLNCYEKGHIEHEFGIDVKHDFTCIDARVLPPPTLKYHDSTITPHLGQWDMINTRMFRGATLNFWTCLNFSLVGPSRAHIFFSLSFEMCGHMGMSISAPMRHFPSLVNPNLIEKVLLEIHDKCYKEGNPLELLVIILPEIWPSRAYRKIKRMCEIELGIITQCCLPHKVMMLNRRYFINVALKINVKGVTLLDDAINRNIPLLSDRPTIIFGADVSHPEAGEDSSASIAAVVASIDWPYMTMYKGLVSAQRHRQEIIQDLYKVEQEPGEEAVHSGMIRELLVAFLKSNKQMPQRIIFYRDGVSEGQFSHVLLYEMEAIRKACASFGEGYLPPVTFVVVQKRHHTRLFPGNPFETDDGNILPGTVVDTKICHPTGHDFYLCSHAGIRGTSRPAHYHVLFDENRFSPDQIQTLTNNLCYTYASCTSSISVVPPIRYAHLAAARATCYVKENGGASQSESGIVVRKGAAPVRPLPSLCSNIKDVMFYC